MSSCLIRLRIGRTSFVFSLRLFGTNGNNWGASLQSTSLFVKFAGQRSVEARCALRCGRDIPSLLMLDARLNKELAIIYNVCPYYII